MTGLDNFDPFYEPTMKEETLAELGQYDGFEFVYGDIRDAAVVAEALANADVILHLAARAGVRPSIEDPILYSSVNVAGTQQLLETCKERGIRRFVFGSSSSVYGDTTPVPFREEEPAVDPISPYAATKRDGELACRVYAHLHGMRVASLRLFTVYGPRQRPDLAIHRFTRLVDDGQPIQRFGDGTSERDYTHVSDIVRGVMGAIRWTGLEGGGFEVFNLGESRTVSLSDLIELIGGALGEAPTIEEVPMQPGDVRRTYADITKAREVLGYDPVVTMEDGINDFVAWYRSR